MVSELHPFRAGPDYRDAEGNPARVIRCPDCGQVEWWTERELADHGRCRTGLYPCACDGLPGCVVDESGGLADWPVSSVRPDDDEGRPPAA